MEDSCRRTALGLPLPGLGGRLVEEPVVGRALAAWPRTIRGGFDKAQKIDKASNRNGKEYYQINHLQLNTGLCITYAVCVLTAAGAIFVLPLAQL